jgi:transposase InsO family protein
MIGPWTITIGETTQKFSALTMIDTVTNLVEVVRVSNKTSAPIALQFENTWLSRYPKPISVTHDQGGEFVGYAFQHRLNLLNISIKSTTSKNPQSNSICERMHQTIGNSLRVLSTMDPPYGADQAVQVIGIPQRYDLEHSSDCRLAKNPAETTTARG